MRHRVGRGIDTAGVFLAIAVCFSSVMSLDARADGKQGHDFGVGIVTGVPELLGVELKWMPWDILETSAGLGSAPINGFLQSQVTLSPIPVDLQTGDTFNLYPSATYSLSTVALGIKLMPWTEGLFIKAGYQAIQFATNYTANLKNETTGGVSNGVISGTLSLSQPVVTPMLGYQFTISPRLYIDLSLGASIMLPANSTLTTGGSLASIMTLSPGGTQNFENAKADLQTQVDNAIRAYQSQLRVFPSMLIGFGIFL